MSCCQNKVYNDNFDLKLAQEELDDYHASGPKKNSLPLINLLKQLELEDASLLDIGSGVGVVIFELFEQGISEAIYSDYSVSYHAAFQQEIKHKSLEKAIRSYVGDFLETHKNINTVDLVTLDKVICCYENYEELVVHSVKKAKKWYAYSVPRDVWWVKFVHYFEQKIKWIKGNPFRTFVHPTQKIESIISQKGFKKIYNHFNREWQTVVFEKIKT